MKKKGGGKLKKNAPLFSVFKYLQMCVYAHKHAHISGKCQDKEILKKNTYAQLLSNSLLRQVEVLG
jgi:hypothetical protein